jgi:hypothetical protein
MRSPEERICADRSSARASTVWRVDEGVEELRGGVAQALLAHRQRFLELGELVGAGLVGRGERAGELRLAGDEVVVRACHRLDLHALGHVAGAAVLAARGGELHRLARVALGVGVGDVGAHGLQGRLVGLHGADADREESGAHGSVRFHAVCVAGLRPRWRAAGAAWC